MINQIDNQLMKTVRNGLYCEMVSKKTGKHLMINNHNVSIVTSSYLRPISNLM